MEIYYIKCINENEKAVGKEILKKVLKSKNFDINELKIEVAPHGKPFCKQLPFDFNISHTKGMAMLVIGNKVGADCQTVTNVKENVLKRVCSPEEYEKLNNSANKTEEFIRMWSFKEAYTKMIGSGFRYDFKQATVENAFCIYPDIKIFQKKINNVILTAIEDKSLEVKITELL